MRVIGSAIVATVLLVLSPSVSSAQPPRSDDSVEEMNREAFENADLDGNGSLDSFEFFDYYDQNEVATNRAFAAADANGDAQLNFNEFVDAISTEA